MIIFIINIGTLGKYVTGTRYHPHFKTARVAVGHRVWAKVLGPGGTFWSGHGVDTRVMMQLKLQNSM